MGNLRRKVSTASVEAQRYFDQGLVWMYAFNHDEAIRSFEVAARHDPNCAMAWWGIALCHGPHINNPTMPPERSQAAWDALQKALALSERAAPAERALIEALSHRYADPPPADRTPLDQSYAAAMREVWLGHRDDPDIGVLYAEAMMDLRPWDLWTAEGKPQPGTDEILSVLEHVLYAHPLHPGANHLYIHAVEASPNPARAVGAADRLRNLVPASGHLTHMPSHIYARLGRWSDAVEANEKAVEADRKYRAISPQQGFYHLYMAHNPHFLSWAAMMEGRSALSRAAARTAVAGVDARTAKRQASILDGFLSIELEAMMRFGQWDDILQQPKPPSYLPITTALWRFIRGVAYAAKGEVARAEKERAAFEKAARQVPEDARVGNNKAGDVLAIAAHVLDGEIAYRRGDIDTAVASLRAGVKIEDELRYNEAPDWLQPVRHPLAAILLAAGRAAEAEGVYREDLARWPNNGWSLHGLARSLRAQGKTAEAEKIEKDFQNAWARADIQIASSCMCVPGN
jgi:tetratricopeptide (TPR) repeat protein